ncbi:Glycerol uptake facilitator protein [Haloplasma contractile SSD-17B]|uniref:Glycerol uptake facilitator protein n=1 Tax=Haloplasma contractile SSD-17B TaxID=1033810 RepID=U2FK75_9MOLU|nr:MIP/aquaporin family protein [Haloplasma contractile]ERJ11634.1 Glycerol uptake facilitator protein [Haloplasma contractile SSD-17B]
MEFFAELIGTALLTLLGGGVCAGVALKKSHANGSGWIVITFGWGFAVAMAVYLSGHISGAHINPAVTIGLAVANKFAWSKVLLYITAQMIGGFVGAAIVTVYYYQHFQATEDEGTVLGVYSTGPAISSTFFNLFSEIIGTFILVLVILVMGLQETSPGLGAIAVGFLVVSIGMSLGGTTGYAINPARDLGPRLAHFFLPVPNKGGSNWKYAWIPVVGPIIGGALAAAFYLVFFA